MFILIKTYNLNQLEKNIKIFYNQLNLINFKKK